MIRPGWMLASAGVCHAGKARIHRPKCNVNCICDMYVYNAGVVQDKMRLWTHEEGVTALRRIIDDAMSDGPRKEELLRRLASLSPTTGLMVKYFLAECQMHGDKKIAQATGDLIKDVFDQFG